MKWSPYDQNRLVSPEEKIFSRVRVTNSVTLNYFNKPEEHLVVAYYRFVQLYTVF